ncbi:MAG: hypothetical protein ACREPM_12870 [Gemmatimonadaceae bacterium]
MQEDAVWDALARALAGEYEIVARLGLGTGDAPVYLARELITDTLVALRLPPLASETETREFGLEVVRQIDGSLPEIETRCSHCGGVLRQWSRFCSHCGRDISGLSPTLAGQTREQLRRMADDAGAGKYEMLGEMTRVEGGGIVYFGRELATGQVLGLQLEGGPDATQLMTAASFGRSDPTIQLPESRRRSGEKTPRGPSGPTTRRLSVPPPAARASTGTKSSWNATRIGLASAAILGLTLAALLVYRFM